MSNESLLPYFHPTQVVLVDNDIDFLGNLSLQLDADLAYLLFDSTEKALHYINERETHTPNTRRFLMPEADEHAGRASGGVPQLDAGAIAQEMFHANRFAQISVAMVDYAMPQMNGLELCRRIRNPSVKKILFTGVATESDAIEAFNSGLIDHYIRKSEHRVYEAVNRRIRELQRAHIRGFFDSAAEVFRFGAPPFLSDHGVISLMEELRRRLSYVEYYLAAAPDGFWLVDADARVWRLVLSDAACRAAQAAFLDTHGAQDAVREQVMNGDQILDPCVMLAGGTPSDAQGQWVNRLRPAARLDGSSAYRWALFEAEAPDHGEERSVFSYNRYVDWIDTQAFSMM